MKIEIPDLSKIKKDYKNKSNKIITYDKNKHQAIIDNKIEETNPVSNNIQEVNKVELALELQILLLQ